ncbi:MAG: glycosyltransferase [Parcubacteria group bacterium]|nr:glycosyltransferase [Parcubacteria group bacterium]
MNILLIITRGDIGGAQTSVFNLAREFSKRGHTVTVGIGRDGDTLPTMLEREGIAWMRLVHLTRGHNPLDMFRFIIEMKNILSLKKYDVLHVNSSNALVAALSTKLVSKKNRPKTVFTFRGMSLLDTHYELSALKRYIYTLFFRIFLPCVDVSVFVSKENMERGKELGMAKNARVIYNGLALSDEDFLSRGEARRELGALCNTVIPDDAFLVGSIGRIAYQKDYAFLVRAFAQLKKSHEHAHLIIIGDGDERALVEKEIEALHLSESVHLVGAVPEGFRFAKAFDLFTLTSRYEGLSITLIEALIAGLPIVASDVGGNAETILPEGLYELGDEEGFLQACERVLRLSEHERKARTKSKADMFTLARTVDEYEEVYRV